MLSIIIDKIYLIELKKLTKAKNKFGIGDQNFIENYQEISHVC